MLQWGFPTRYGLSHCVCGKVVGLAGGDAARSSAFIGGAVTRAIRRGYPCVALMESKHEPRARATKDITTLPRAARQARKEWARSGTISISARISDGKGKGRALALARAEVFLSALLMRNPLSPLFSRRRLVRSVLSSWIEHAYVYFFGAPLPGGGASLARILPVVRPRPGASADPWWRNSLRLTPDRCSLSSPLPPPLAANALSVPCGAPRRAS